MTSERSHLDRPFGWIDGGFFLAGVASLVTYVLGGNDPFLALGGYAFLLGTSTLVVTQGLERFTGDAIPGRSDIDEDTGWLIGKLENVLVLTFTLAGAYTALSIVFAAKSIIRREDMSSENTTYYLAGTLLNFTYSVVVGLAVVRLEYVSLTDSIVLLV